MRETARRAMASVTPMSPAPRTAIGTRRDTTVAGVAAVAGRDTAGTRTCRGANVSRTSSTLIAIGVSSARHGHA
ncbi:hypothetical protein [Blastococcus brunescens]|uniref:Uncharacterized protein n=1 Tax=Blastococcus brunescens TaxID=1564165 RepID=A0ABZ1B1K4_9ACTN|nr:hypothetical protein [Blastococcus sp. BMG 8361]WRL64691.1 hypothetical protein U6N30_02595 [Blastococcus sp. BMG 8361]